MGGTVTLSRTAGQSLLPFTKEVRLRPAHRAIGKGHLEGEGARALNPRQEAAGVVGNFFALIDLSQKG